MQEANTTLENRKEFRSKVMLFQEALTAHPDSFGPDDGVCPLKHSFADGCYIREIYNPKGVILVTKIHKVAHPFFLLKGEMSILTERGAERIKAPYYGITPAGTKRIIYTHEEIVFVTVHVTKETDLKKIEEEVIAKSFEELNEGEQEKVALFLKEASCLGL